MSKSELRVLGALWLLGGSGYALNIMRAGRMGSGTLYPALQRLEHAGLVRREGGLRVRYYLEERRGD